MTTDDMFVSVHGRRMRFVAPARPCADAGCDGGSPYCHCQGCGEAGVPLTVGLDTSSDDGFCEPCAVREGIVRCPVCDGRGYVEAGPTCTARCGWCGGCYDGRIVCPACGGPGDVYGPDDGPEPDRLHDDVDF